MKRKWRLPLVVALLAVVGALAGVAIADTYNSPAKVTTLGNNTLVWTGQGTTGGNLDDVECTGDTPPGTLLWIFTFDGATLGSPDPVLHLGGSGSGDYTGTNFGNEWHIFTPFFDLGTLTANVTFNVTSLGNSPGGANMVLTISHGCPKERPPASAPTITKDAFLSFDRECDWTIDKTANPREITAAEGAPATFNYTVTVKATCDRIEHVQVSGTITVFNPNPGPVIIGPTGITDVLSDGTVCVVFGDGPGTILAPGPNPFPYTCPHDNTLPSPDTTNTATVDWGDQDVPNDGHLTAGSATTGPVGIQPTEPTLTDNCVDVSDPLDAASPRHFCVDASGGSFTYSYQATYPAPKAGTCESHDNTASFADNSRPQRTGSASAKVTVCSLGVAKTAQGSFDRECDWKIDKTVQPREITAAAGDPATFNYGVTVSATCNRIEHVKVTGTITVTNPEPTPVLLHIHDQLSDGTVCLDIDLSVPPPGVTVPYSCGLPNGNPPSDLTNTVTITWDNQENVDAAGNVVDVVQAGSASATVPVTFKETLTDNCVDVSDTLGGPLGNFCVDASGGSKTFNYPLTFPAPPAGTCKDIANEASFVDNSEPRHTGSASATVTVCSLGVDKTAQASFDRECDWKIDKAARPREITAAAGDPATFNYTVGVSATCDRIENTKLTGVITVTNPEPTPVTLHIHDELSDGTVCLDIPAVAVPPPGLAIPYSCDVSKYNNTNGIAPPDLENRVTIDWPDQENVDAAGNVVDVVLGGSASASVPVKFEEKLTDNCVQVNDTLGGDLGNHCVQRDASGNLTGTSVQISYPLTFHAPPAGTCKDIDNTASFADNSDPQHTGSASATVRVCSLGVDKTAQGSFDRECDWTIAKAVNPQEIDTDAGKPATFNYNVTVSATCKRIEKTKLAGTITVHNPESSPVLLDNIHDELSDGTVCLDTGPVTVSPGDTPFPFVCDVSKYNNTNGTPPPDLRNTVTITWSDQSNDGDVVLGGSASASVPVTFKQNLTDNCVDVSDTLQGSLGNFCVDASGGSKTYSYSLTFTAPPAVPGQLNCERHSNTASFADNSQPQNTGSASQTVKVCSFGPRFTPGYWKNHLAPTGSSGCTGLPSGTSCSNNGPWAMSDPTKFLGSYGPINTPKKAADVFAAMSCSFSGNAANQNQQAIGCLAGHLLAAKYNRNINASNPCIDATIAAADAFLISISYIGPTGNYTTITAAQRATAISLKNSLDAYNNGGFC